MKTTIISTLQSKLELRLAKYTAVAALGLVAAAPQTRAAVVYSGPVSIAVPATTDGLYLDLVTGQSSPSYFNKYDFNPFGSTSLEFYAPSNAPFKDGVVGTASGATALTPLTSTVSSTSRFQTSAVLAPAFDTVGTEYAGIKFENDTTSAVNYGWVELATTSATGYPATIVGYAYDDSGAPIVVGQIAAVPEPGVNAALGLGALALGAVGVRRWQRSKQATA